MFSQQFRKDLEAWKKTRPEYGNLLAAIKAGKSVGELAELASDAGSTMGQVHELRTLRTRATAPHRRKQAARFEKLQEEVDAIIAKIAETDKNMAMAKTRLQQDELEGQFYDMVETRQRMQLELAGCGVAAGLIAAAAEAGVI